MTPLLIIDVSNICHRAFYALSHARSDLESATVDVTYSFFQTMVRLQSKFGTDRFAFCFDHPVFYRRDIFPDYKRKRHQDKSPEDLQKRVLLHEQINKLGKVHLRQIGFNNIFRARGMESDDLMAAIALSRPPEEDVVLITSDGDMLQCLRKNVSMYSPHTRKMTTRNSFMETYGIYPKQWAKVKAMAGCSSDGVPGLLGVGEQGALRYLRGELKETSSQFHWITCEKGQKMISECLRLVKLPLEGCPVPEIVEDSDLKWRKMDRIRL